MTDAAAPATPYTFTIDVMNIIGAPGTNASFTMNTWKIAGAYLTLQDDTYIITDTLGNTLAAVQRFGVIVTRDDATSYIPPGTA